MRIHTIRLSNLNALTGTWEIDLDHPAYADNIYALTGPTGAGKTTILDAISLALYGRTPRLARIGKAGNEIMSRHSGTCHAEITFSTRTGRYRSHWSQHRARRKAGGELQNPKHELADAESGELLATGLKDVAAAIERLTGMDYQRFTRAMLLAQGDFAAFLRAAPDERAPLLEQITGTEIYSRISIAVHERLRDALEQQRQLATETAGITPLDAATHTALTQESAALQKQLAALATRQQQTAAALARAQNIAELTAELARLDEQHTAHQAALARFAPERERLAAAQSAALLDADYARLDTLRRAQQQNSRALAALDEQAPALARTHETANQALTAASARVHSEKQRLAAAQPRWQQTRAYDHTLRHQREQLATLEQSAAAHTAAQTALAAAEKHAAAARENSARADVARKKTETALAAHLQGRLLREYRAEKENILRELAYHQRIADLEQQRAHLHDGEPCPLCGATEHPYASELPAQPDDLTTRLEALDTYIKQAETLNEQHENAQRALASAREKQQQTENTLALAAEKARNSAVHAEQHAALQQTYAQTLAARQALLANRDPDAEETAQQHAIAEAEAAMEKARDTCQTAQSAAAANQQQRAQLHARLTAQQQELQTAEQQFAVALGMCSEIAAPSPAGRSPQRGRDGEGVDDVPCAPKISTFSISDHPHSNTSSRAATTFPDETAWQAARLPAATREALARQAAALDQQTLTLHTRQQDRAARLASLTAQSTDDPDTATLQARQEADEHTRQQHQQTLAANQHRLAEHERASERLAAQQQAIAKQAAETRRWQNLHELIGAADGKKYRNYAQSLTFASVIAQANRQLVQLSDRYLLTADPARPLELNIIDNYQGGETRSAKNLSGGESFIVSLALALGLAQMSGENMQIDTLFLDEGFGTLDEETLDSALETLSQLRTHGKHIGIISHVAALTERIATRIQITPQNGGNSIISGPGCRRVE
ncbi:AAA family ATPase [Cardiobacterium hominis]|uniref:Exonuclease SbcC n=1 Tax=Cardiobacterium hominis TaxID=2718 RepID=A0A1C3H5Q9_9GAMM|nr:AAA family ATPase [Cardiobacterium hominis]SAM68397.1 Exonuclease SbcC [Cardiobacterium hominis]